MSHLLPIRSALISVWHKQGLEPIVRRLNMHGATIYSTGGTADYLRGLGAHVVDVADLTGYPSILGGRVKTLHPKVHGGILARREEAQDMQELAHYEIPEIDLVIVDLYPFQATVDSGAGEEEVVEKIDIGGIALIRAAAKNFPHVVCVPSQAYYAQLAETLEANNGQTSLADRMTLAAAAFEVSSHYDTAIYRYLAKDAEGTLKISEHDPKPLRYGENPHQQGWFYGDLSKKFEQLGGKELSFNNLVDIEAALQLVDEFEEPTFAVIKHTNPCGCATAPDLLQAWQKALEADPLSAFGGVLACNSNIDAAVAVDIDKIFFEVLAADAYTEEALAILGKKKNRILLLRKDKTHAEKTVRSLLGGYLVQDRDAAVAGDLQLKTSRPLSETEVQDAVFADTVCKHMKSNAIALVKNRQLIGGGVGQTSRIDSLKQAVAKAKEKGFDLEGAVLASDAFFPFADSVQTAFEAGIRVVIEPGGSVKDQDSVDFCETHDMSLIFTGLRHFKH